MLGEAGLMDTQGQSAASDGGDAALSPIPLQTAFGLVPFVTVLGGGAITGLIAAVLLNAFPISDGVGVSTIQAIEASDLEASRASLAPETATSAIAEALACKAPLAYVTVSTAPGMAPGNIRVQSGSYLSPSLVVTSTPQRIAVPFPAPYEAGHGVINLEGYAEGLTVWLNPSWHTAKLAGVAPVNVVWSPGKRC